VRSPLIVRWGSAIDKPGRWTNQYAHVIDLVPTILQAAGATHPPTFGGHAILPLEGQSLMPTLVADAPPADRLLGFEHESNRALIDGKWKLVTKNFASSDGGSPANALELYDLGTDPTELRNVAASRPQILTRMVGEWNDWATRVGVPAARILPVPP
jgi:arylsulfatase